MMIQIIQIQTDITSKNNSFSQYAQEESQLEWDGKNSIDVDSERPILSLFS